MATICSAVGCWRDSEKLSDAHVWLGRFAAQRAGALDDAPEHLQRAAHAALDAMARLAEHTGTLLKLETFGAQVLAPAGFEGSGSTYVRGLQFGDVLDGLSLSSRDCHLTETAEAFASLLVALGAEWTVAVTLD
jgi:hypothetical protein